MTSKIVWQPNQWSITENQQFMWFDVLEVQIVWILLCFNVPVNRQCLSLELENQLHDTYILYWLTFRCHLQKRIETAEEIFMSMHIKQCCSKLDYNFPLKSFFFPALGSFTRSPSLNHQNLQFAHSVRSPDLYI